jgi:nickel-dependent lactate racemase
MMGCESKEDKAKKAANQVFGAQKDINTQNGTEATEEEKQAVADLNASIKKLQGDNVKKDDITKAIDVWLKLLGMSKEAVAKGPLKKEQKALLQKAIANLNEALTELKKTDQGTITVKNLLDAVNKSIKASEKIIEEAPEDQRKGADDFVKVVKDLIKDLSAEASADTQNQVQRVLDVREGIHVVDDESHIATQAVVA